MNFTSDNCAGAAPQILTAIAAASKGSATAYGKDEWTLRAEAKLCEIFERELAVFLVPTGTAANALALAALTRPFDAVFCHEEAHIQDDECGAPEFFTHGAKLVGVPGEGGKMRPRALAETLLRYPRGVSKSVQPGALSLSQVTEAGTLYTVEEIRALTALAQEAGLPVHMDGARFANALAALGASPAEMTWKAGVDALSFGATKNGALACEAVIFFDPAKGETFPYLRKRGGHTISKGRLLGAQMEAYLEGGLWLQLAKRANVLARRLYEGLTAIPGLRAAWEAQANEVFLIAPLARAAAWREAGAGFYEWSTRSLPFGEALAAGETILRLVTSFETSDEEIQSFLALAKDGC